LSITVGVIDKIKKKRLFDVKIFRRYKKYYGKNTKKIHNIFIWEETLFISLSFKKKIGIVGHYFRKYGHFKKREIIGNLGQQILLQLR
jgi:hypothetical protein